MADLTEYIYKEMIERRNDYQWRMVENSHKRALEIYLTITHESDEEIYMQDINGAVNEPGIIYFEELVCFYDKNDARIAPSNYLYAIPVDLARGIEVGYVDAFLKQLNIIIGKSHSQLHDFLQDETQTEFMLRWNKLNMENTIETMRQTGRYSTDRLILFAEDDDQSIVDQFKEEMHDGLVRI